MSKYIKSKYLQYIECTQDIFFVYHSLFNRHKIVNKYSIAFLSLFDEPFDISELSNLPESFHALFDEMKYCYFIIKTDEKERDLLKAKFNLSQYKDLSKLPLETLGLTVTKECNFACKYCMSNHLLDLSKNFGSNSNMRFDIAKKSIDFYVDILKKKNQKKLSIYFNGGEPLLRFNFIKKVINYCTEHYSNKFEIKYSISTNGSLLTDEIARFFKVNNVDIITMSLDGPKSTNDLIRLYRSGKSAYNDIIKAIKTIQKHSNRKKGIYTTLCNENFFLLNEQFLDLCKDELSLKNIHIEPDLVNLLDINPEEICNKIFNLYNYGKSINIIISCSLFRPFQNIFNDMLKMERIGWCAAATGHSIDILPSGQVSRCCYSTKNFGNFSQIAHIINSTEWEKFIIDHSYGNIKRCKGCEIEGACLGGCFLTEESDAFNDKDQLLYHRCELFKYMTKKLIIDWVHKRFQTRNKDC